MPLASLFALALMAAPAPAPTAAPAGLPEEPVPAGAPSDDYGLVNWCAGALSGHMVLYHRVKPELDALPDASPKETAALDADQIKAGREYLELYKKAIEAAEKASPRSIADQGLQDRKVGSAIWAAARATTDGKTRMWTWLSWELPGRCETAAERLYEKSLLSAQALGIDLVGGSSAASNKTVTPQIDPVAPAKTPTKSKTPVRKPAPGIIIDELGPVAPTTPAPASVASNSPASATIEDQFQAEIEGRASLPKGPGA
jgi:hypothetical protein